MVIEGLVKSKNWGSEGLQFQIMNIYSNYISFQSLVFLIGFYAD